MWVCPKFTFISYVYTVVLNSKDQHGKCHLSCSYTPSKQTKLDLCKEASKIH